MKIALIFILLITAIYVVIALAIAKFFSILILKPPAKFRSSYDAIRKQKAKEIATDRAVFAGIDWKDFDGWDKEVFSVKNDEITIQGEYYPIQNHKGVVICAHGFGQNKLQEAPHAALYRELGFSTIIYDQRCWGENDAPFCSFGYYEATDMACIVEWVKEKCGEDTKIVVTGVSMGGVTVMNALTHTENIDYAINDCGFARFREGCYYVYMSLLHLPNPFVVPMIIHDAHRLGIPMEKNNPIDSVANSNTPLLIVHGDADRAVNVQDAYNISKVMKNPNSRMEIFPGYDHGYCLSDREHYKAVVADFLKEIM